MRQMLCYVLFFLMGASAVAAVFTDNKLKYRTYFGTCPSRSAGSLTLNLIKIFEDEMSLKAIKQEILLQRLDQKHFISNYQIKFDPLRNFMVINFECPRPLMRVQVVKDGSDETYNAILVENGDLYDPTYEVLLRDEQKLKQELPYLALPLKEMDKNIQHHIARLIKTFKHSVRDMLSEVILNDNLELTVIMSIQGRPTSVFMGKNEWIDKVDKLEQIVTYMQAKNKIPAIINLTNSKKVVVKFNE